VSIWEKGSCRDSQVMGVVRLLFFLLTRFNINLLFRHVPGSNNSYANLLSRLQVPKSIHRPETRHPSICLDRLRSMTNFYIRAALSPATQATYRPGLNSFRRFCFESHHVPFPPAEDLVCSYMSHLGELVSYKIIKVYLAGSILLPH